MEPHAPLNAFHRTVAASAAAALLAVLVVGASFWSFLQSKDAAAERKRTDDLVSRAEVLLSDLKDAETGQRGYLLTGDETYLGPYLATRDGVHPRLADLRQRTRIGASLKHLDALGPLIRAKLAELSDVIALRRLQDLPAAQALVRTGRGKLLMESIRTEIGAFIGIEERAAAQSDATFQSHMRTLFALIVTASGCTLLFVLSFTYLVSRDGQHRLKALVHLETEKLLARQEETSDSLRRAYGALHVSEARLSVTLQSIGDAVIATDGHGRVTILNPLAEKLTGWTQAEAAARPADEVFRIVDEVTRQPSTVPLKDVLALGADRRLPEHAILISRGGGECAIADSCAPIRDPDGQVVGAVLVFRDVTEETAAQHALRDSAVLLQTILNTVVDGIITLAPSGGIIETANPAAEKMFGYATADFIGLPLSLLIPALDLEQSSGLLGVRRVNGETNALGLGREVTAQRRDGRLFPLEVAVGEMWLGGTRHFTVLLRDITARRNAEEALKTAGALQHAIFNSEHFSSIATDAKGVIQIFNVGAERMLGYKAADVLNKITPADISDAQEVIARAQALSAELATTIAPGFEALVYKASRGIEDIYELTYIRKDGTRFPAVVSVTALRDDQGTVIGYLLIGTDNTARKQVEAEQERLSQRLRDHQFYTRSLFEANIDALMTTDPAGIITDVNKQMEALTGCTRDELIGAPFKSYFTDPDMAEASIKLVLSEKKVTNYELTASARDGRDTVVSFNATTFYDRNRRLQGVFAAARDVTERKLLDEVLLERNVELQTARTIAEKANFAKSEFLSSMSHELRSPLNAILGFAQLMESDSLPPTPAQRESISQILQAGWHLLKLIDEILDLARVESGKVPLSREPVSLGDVLLQCQGMIEPHAQQRRIHMSYPRFETPCFVYADRTRLKQVLINLLSNAIKYNSEQGSVAVTCREITPGRTRLSITDTGAGLSPEQLPLLFQAFHRLGQEAGDVEGTGIGLVVAKRLVELMGGVIGMESTVGVGSEFWFELDSSAPPRLPSEYGDAPAPASPSPSSGLRRRTVLYVEDNPANLTLVAQIVARHPAIRMLAAADGKSGIDLARASQPDVILMDINLPGINGFEALRQLRADPATAGIPVIAISANAMPSALELGRKAGFFRYITKPLKVAEFMETLELALELSASGSSPGG
jgi:PAS domain S-box-containing protein